jgi:sRNA-binding carbon storage regulator CsrA
MPDHVLVVGDTLVVAAAIRLTVLAVEGDSVILGVTAPGLSRREIPPGVRQKRRPRRTATPTPLPSQN